MELGTAKYKFEMQKHSNHRLNQSKCRLRYSDCISESNEWLLGGIIINSLSFKINHVAFMTHWVVSLGCYAFFLFVLLFPRQIVELKVHFQPLSSFLMVDTLHKPPTLKKPTGPTEWKFYKSLRSLIESILENQKIKKSRDKNWARESW